MAASKAYRRFCIQCGRPRDEVGRPRGDHRVLSYRGKCPDCAKANMEAQQEAAYRMADGDLAKYRTNVAASVGARLPDQADSDP